MKITLSCLIVIILLMFGSPVRALEPFVLYDDFSSKTKIIDEARWYGQESIVTGANIVEDVRQISSGKLHMLSRAYGNVSSDAGITSARTRLLFSNPGPITAMKATVQVKGIEADGCANNAEPTVTRVGLFGSFFNPGQPPAGSLLNDVQVYIAIELASDSTNEPGILNVVGSIRQCGNATCSTLNTLVSQTLGTIKLKGKTDLSMQWDKPNQQFIFQFGKLAPSPLSYSGLVADTFPPSVDIKRLDLSYSIANCTIEPRISAFAEAYFDNVFVNQSAAP